MRLMYILAREKARIGGTALIPSALDQFVKRCPIGPAKPCDWPRCQRADAMCCRWPPSSDSLPPLIIGLYSITPLGTSFFLSHFSPLPSLPSSNAQASYRSNSQAIQLLCVAAFISASLSDGLTQLPHAGAALFDRLKPSTSPHSKRS